MTKWPARDQCSDRLANTSAISWRACHRRTRKFLKANDCHLQCLPQASRVPDMLPGFPRSRSPNIRDKPFYIPVQSIHILGRMYSSSSRLHFTQTLPRLCPSRPLRGCNSRPSFRAYRDGHILADDSESPHFWPHHQERALMRVAVAFDQPHLSRIAIESAFELFGQAVVSQFAGRQRTLPYEVSCASCTFDAVYRVSGDPRARELAELARAWFCGRNAASSPVYDPVRQLTYDGVDGESVSSNSGAESNIEAAFALYSVLPWNHLAAP